MHIAPMDQYVYQQLDPLVDSIRLITLEPSDDPNAPVGCRLDHVAFGQIPKYDALSYTWGDEPVKNSMSVDGKELKIGQNLFEALRCLRNRTDALPLWADAICINQKDITERNRQLHIMPHIYTRARNVLIWLGSKYTASEGKLLQNWANKTYEHVKLKKKKNTDWSLQLEICRNPYWERVWVVQEIGKARSIQVCFDSCSLPWRDFIASFFWASKRHAIDDHGPLKFARQLKNKYRESHTLFNLLQTYEDTKCKDPRDKIYGFVGLASDCYGFPVDYSKSTYEIWTDTILFMSRNNMVKASLHIELGRLVKRLLGCELKLPSEPTTPRSVPPLSAPPYLGFTNTANKNLIKLSVAILGDIILLGPSPEEMVSNLHEVDQWTAALYKNFGADFGKASEENDAFLHALEGLDQATLETITIFDKTDYHPISDGLEDMTATGKEAFEIHRKFMNEAFLAADYIEQFDTSTHQLLQYQDLSGKSRNGIMGIGPGQACKGDLVCKTRSQDQALVVRTLYGSEARIIGTAVLSSDLFGEDKASDALDEGLPRLNIVMDLEDLYALSN